MRIRRVRAELFHADGQTDGMKDRQMDVTKPKAAFQNFSNTPKMPLLAITFCSGS